jgi:hypothetical protein
MAHTTKRQDGKIPAMRFACIFASPAYPIISSYEFNFLQKENVIRERLSASTIYLIVQRPLTYFDNVEINDTGILFEITDGDNTSLPCLINLLDNNIRQAGERIDVRVGFHSKKSNDHQPLRNVAGFQLYRENGDFILWWSPQKLLYEMLVKNLIVETAEEFNPSVFLDFKVHYIGKSFSQNVWDRLTGHDKMQSILTLEPEVGLAPEARAPFEISLIILQVNGFDDLPFRADTDSLPLDPDWIVTMLDDDEESITRFASAPNIQPNDEALTREVEALLIHHFKPSYNSILFNKYPNIAGGMRSKGYSRTQLCVQQIPTSLYTDNFSVESTDLEFLLGELI